MMEVLMDENCVQAEKPAEEMLRMLDRGIDDMEEGRELPLEQAFDKITELRKMRRNARL